MDRLVKADVQEIKLCFIKDQKCSATFSLTNLMHTMSVAVSFTTTNPSLFSFLQNYAIIPPLSTSIFTIFTSQPCDLPPLSTPLDAVLVRSSMLPTGKAQTEELRRLFSKPGPHIFRDVNIPVAFVGHQVVESLILSPVHKSLEVTFLLEKSVSCCSKAELDSLLCCAAKCGNSYFASALIEAGADVNCRDSDGQSVVSLAVKSGNLDAVKVLVEAGYSIDNSDDQLILHDAAAMNRLDMIEILCLRVHIDVNSINTLGQTALHVAATNGNLEVVEFLVNSGGCPDIVDHKGWTPLHYATQEGHVEAVELLLKSSTLAKLVVTKLEQKTAYDLAVDEGHYCLYDVLHLRDELHRAARTGDVQAIKECLDQGANVNSKDQNGWTPLHRAAFRGRIESVQLLLNYGAKVDLVDDIGYTPLHLAVESGHTTVALYLIAHGAKGVLKSLKGVKSLRDLDRFRSHPSFVKQVGQAKEKTQIRLLC